MTTYPKYVLITDLQSASASILRRRPYPSPSKDRLPGEYENVANGQLAEMRILFTDLTKEEDKGTPEIQGTPRFCRATPDRAELIKSHVCIKHADHPGDHLFQELAP